jgi:hypothetical protein
MIKTRIKSHKGKKLRVDIQLGKEQLMIRQKMVFSSNQ